MLSAIQRVLDLFGDFPLVKGPEPTLCVSFLFILTRICDILVAVQTLASNLSNSSEKTFVSFFFIYIIDKKYHPATQVWTKMEWKIKILDMLNL